MKDRISDGWFRRFLERQPQLRLCKGDCTAFVQLSAMNNNEALDSYYRELKSILDSYNLHDKPENIYNVDETGMPLDHRASHILAKKKFAMPHPETSLK